MGGSWLRPLALALALAGPLATAAAASPASATAAPRQPHRRPAPQPEPSCEELKAMWRFSKRQSRAAELTNELPMYRDPFADNVWEPYYASARSVGGGRIGFRSKPVVYGRVVHNPPYGVRFQTPQERQQLMEELARLYGMPAGHAPQLQQRRRLTTFRGAAHLAFPPAPQQGSFNHLKELIKTERARELQQQRLIEESAARAAAIKDIARNSPARYASERFSYEADEPELLMMEGDDEPDEPEDEEEAEVEPETPGVIAFPDLLAPAGGPAPANGRARFSSEYGAYRRGTAAQRARHRPAQAQQLFDSGGVPYRGAYGYVL